LPFIAGLPLTAAAQTLDLSGPYGNGDGCKLAKQGFMDSDAAVLLKSDGFVTYGSSCEFVQVLLSKDGTKVVTGLCHSEGEEGLQARMFVVGQNPKDPKGLVIYDNDGAIFGEVAPCQ
jgi:hypothetical protein